MDADDGSLVQRIDEDTPQSAIDELCEKLPDFRKAYDEDGLAVHEYADYGPVQLFRNAFLHGCYLLLAEIPARRHWYAL
jgi:transaldolase